MVKFHKILSHIRMKKIYFRKNIEKMNGYVPGEQPQIKNIIKLNTNENPYPTAPNVEKVLKNINISDLKKYPDPLGNDLRDKIATLYNLQKDNVILGNGSDDILTIVMRAFANENDKIVCVAPSYSLYPILANIQNVQCKVIELNKDFSLPKNMLNSLSKAKIFFLPRPNAPTGTTFPKEEIISLCKQFKGIILIDEAYADFAENNCIDLVEQFDNVIISRTLSKSYSLAGIRLGFALAAPEIISGLMKVKDSYNISTLTQKIAIEAISNQSYLEKNIKKICDNRKFLSSSLKEVGFNVLPSETNFLFVSPPNEDGEKYFEYLRKNNIIVRYFPETLTKKFVRISIGTKQEMVALINITKQMLN